MVTLRAELAGTTRAEAIATVRSPIFQAQWVTVVSRLSTQCTPPHDRLSGPKAVMRFTSDLRLGRETNAEWVLHTLSPPLAGTDGQSVSWLTGVPYMAPIDT